MRRTKGEDTIIINTSEYILTTGDNIMKENKLIYSSWKEQTVIERIPLSCRNVPGVILLVEKQTGKNGFIKGCSRECHLCHREKCV